MPRGGYREGAGRPKGSKNKRSLEMQRIMEERARELEDNLENCTDLDAHGVLMSLYKDLNQPTNVRLEAAKAACAYEKPRLAATAVDLNDGHRSFEDLLEELDTEAWVEGKGYVRMSREEKRAHVIEQAKSLPGYQHIAIPNNSREELPRETLTRTGLHREIYTARGTDSISCTGDLVSQNIDGACSTAATTSDNTAEPLADDGNTVETMSGRISKFRSIMGK